jgi:hypothetical protein
MRKTWVFLGLVAVLSFSGFANAFPILDQEQELDPNASRGMGFLVTLSQTFTVGVTGYLDSVEVLLGCRTCAGEQNNYTFSLSDTTVSGTPDLLTEIVAVNIAVNQNFDPPQWQVIDLSPYLIPVSAGEILAMNLKAPGTELNQITWQALGSDGGYGGGEGYMLNPVFFTDWKLIASGEGFPYSSFDFNFRTYVEPLTPVPEPSTLLLIGSGLIGLAGYGRKKLFKK